MSWAKRAEKAALGRISKAPDGGTWQQWAHEKARMDAGAWFELAPWEHRGGPKSRIWKTRLCDFDIMVSYRPGKGYKASYRRIRRKGFPFTEFARYPALSTAQNRVWYDFGQVLLRFEL